MTLADSAKVVVSGAYERRRGYLFTTITTWNQITVSATVAIWAFVLRWETVLKASPNWQAFAIETAWAGALSSVLIGIWRLYAHLLDHAIVSLYPVLYLFESVLLPRELWTIPRPKECKIEMLPHNGKLSESDIEMLPHNGKLSESDIEYKPVIEKHFEGRGHNVIDGLAISIIVLFAALSLYLGLSSGSLTLGHPIVCLLLGNAAGVALIVVARLRWRNRKHNWPVPKQTVDELEPRAAPDSRG